jgi:hypothetical protein
MALPSSGTITVDEIMDEFSATSLADAASKAGLSLPVKATDFYGLSAGTELFPDATFWYVMREDPAASSAAISASSMNLYIEDGGFGNTRSSVRRYSTTGYSAIDIDIEIASLDRNVVITVGPVLYAFGNWSFQPATSTKTFSSTSGTTTERFMVNTSTQDNFGIELSFASGNVWQDSAEAIIHKVVGID